MRISSALFFRHNSSQYVRTTSFERFIRRRFLKIRQFLIICSYPGTQTVKESKSHDVERHWGFVWELSNLLDYSIVRLTIKSRKRVGDISDRADTGFLGNKFPSAFKRPNYSAVLKIA